MPKKTPPPNAFALFVQDFRDRQGRKFNNAAEAFKAAGPHWHNMSKDQRRPYEEKAKKMKENALKYTSEGVPVDHFLQEAKMKENFIENMKCEIKHTIEQAHKNNRLEEETFFVIHMNIFFESNGIYYPAEIGLAAFTIKNGITDNTVFHRMILPGKLPLGSALSVRQKCEFHKIDPPGISSTENNQLEVFEEMIDFIKANMSESTRYPPLYTAEDNRLQIQSILQQWEEAADWKSTLVVYNLQPMFTFLKNTVAGELVWPTETFSNRELEKDVNAFASDIACQYHEMCSAVPFCSRSIVCRYAFTICDNCAGGLGVALMPGRHVPKTSVLKKNMSDTSSTASRSSSRCSSRSYQESDDNNTVSWESDSIASDLSDLTLNSVEDFPPLGGEKKSNSTSYDYLSNNSSGTMNSWASNETGAGFSRRPAALPSFFDKSLSFRDENAFPSLSMGRGRRRGNDSDSSQGTSNARK